MATEAKIKITGDAAELKEALDNVRAESEKLQQDLSRIAKIGAVAFAGFSAGIAATVNEAAKFQQIEAQFKTLTGSVLIAKEVLQDLQDFSATTPFQFEDIANAGKQLIAFGTPVEEVKNRLQEIGDVAAASGAGVKDLTLIFGQVAAAGKLTGERLLQLQERAVPIGPALAKTLGIAESEVKEFVSAGKVSVDDFNEAFASLSQEGGFAFGGIEAQGRTLNGLISTLKDNFSLVAASIGQELLPFASQAVGAITKFIQKIRENEEAVKSIAKFLVAGAGISAFVSAIAVAGIALSKFKVLLQATFTRFSPVVTGAITSVNNFNRAILQGAVQALQSLVRNILLGSASVLRFGLNIRKNASALAEFGRTAIRQAVQGLRNFVTASRNASTSALSFIKSIGPRSVSLIKQLPIALKLAVNSFKTFATNARLAGTGAANFFRNIGPKSLAILKSLPGLLTKAGKGFNIMNVGMRVASIGAKILTGALTLGLGIILPELILLIQDFVKKGIDGFNKASKEIFATFKNLGTNLLNIGSKIADFLKDVFTFNFDNLENSAGAARQAVNKAIDDAFRDVKKVDQKIEIETQREQEGAGQDDIDNSLEERLQKEKEQAEKAAAERRKIKANETEAIKAEEQRQTRITEEQEGLRADIINMLRSGASQDSIDIKQKEIDLLEDIKKAETDQDKELARVRLQNFREQSKELQKERARDRAILARQEDLRNDIVKLEREKGTRFAISEKQKELALLEELANAETQAEINRAQQRLNNFRLASEERRIEAQNQLIQERQEKKALQAEFDALDEEDRILAQEEDLSKLSEEQLQRREALRQFAQEERAAKQRERNQFVKDEQKFGKSQAKVRQALRSEEVQGTKQATGELVQLQQSRNSKLKSIGKAAAITQILIKGAESAANVFEGFTRAVPPPAGPILGGIAAAAAIAFAGERAAEVKRAQTGGVVPGAGSGDIVPAFLEPGEIVVPKALSPSFQEQFSIDPDPGAEGNRRSVEVRFDTIIGSEEFVRDVIIPSIKDATELENADIGVS